MTGDKVHELRDAWVTADDEYHAALAAITRTTGVARHTAWDAAEDKRKAAQERHDEYNCAALEYERYFRAQYGGPEYGL